ncbi:MAG: YbjQ family protein [Candidatus Thiodiazotropha sp. (ex Cardiolucina cf. quadrata)]|nr:YbjQ family protein [Candidatus Thiodiazotropha sp. (ex Cardiolucina cf. quadrata)]
MTDIILFLILMTLGYGFGQYTEKKHYRLLIEREKTLNQLPAIASRIPPTNIVYDQQLVIGSVVISVDYFKRFVAGLRNLFGGRVTTYEGLLDRARREALLRMKSQARTAGAKLVFNVKYETASISKGRRNSIGSVEVLAYGTAMIPPRSA